MTTQYDIGVCISEQGHIADSLVTLTYSILIGKIDSAIADADPLGALDTLYHRELQEGRKQLVISQRAWVEMSGSTSEFVWDVLGGGTSRSSESGAEWIKDAYDRIRRLHDLEKLLFP